MAKKQNKEPVVRSPNFRQIIVDHVYAREEDNLRLVIATDSVSGTHDNVKVEAVTEVELLLTPDSVELIEYHLKHWHDKLKKGKKPK